MEKPERMIAKGRGAVSNPPNRFERLRVELDPETLYQDGLEVLAQERRPIQTTFFVDDSQSIVSRNDSPDIGFEVSLNPYRGCEHGCAYCYARPYHEYLGFNSGLDFETKIMVKPRAAELLEAELSKPSWKPSALACSGVTDCYQPIERKLEITRQCLDALRRFRHPVGIVTKNFLVTRDIDILAELAAHRAASVFMSVTTLDNRLAARLEPRAAAPQHRLRAIRMLRDAGVPVAVNVAPIIPGLNDHEIPAILEAAADHGAGSAGFTLVRLSHAVKEVFAQWLEENTPGQREKVLGRIREIRGGKLNDARFGSRMRGEGPLAEEIGQRFRVFRRRHGLDQPLPKLSTAGFTPPHGKQMEFFGFR